MYKFYFEIMEGENIMDVSVIMTVFNGKNTIKKSIDSILKQTYSNFEFIIVDDGSTDETREILEEYGRVDNRIRVIYKGRIGRSKALNVALNECKGKYIANIDADDEAHPDRLRREYTFLKKNPEIALISSRAKIIFDDEIVNWEKFDNDVFDSISVSDGLKKSNPISHSSVMFNFKLIPMKENIYNEKLSRVVDYDLWIRLYNKGYKLSMINEKLVTKRIHSNQSFENKNRIAYLKAVRKVQLDSFSHQLSISDYLYIQLKFFYGLIPQKLRMLISKKY